MFHTVCIMPKTNSEAYSSVVHQSLMEKGYKPMSANIWTYYLRNFFKKAYGLTWFYGQWWCSDQKIEQKIVNLSSDLDQIMAKHLNVRELEILKNFKTR